MPFQKVPGHKAPWEEIDQASLRQFFETVSGQRYLDQMFLRRPVPTEKTDPVKRSMQSCVAEGYEDFYATSRFLCKPESLARPAPSKQA